jgi:endonuclease YncB( thermonuclease family)
MRRQVGILGSLGLGCLLIVLGTANARAALTLSVDGKVYRLDGIDAPELDQTCLDSAGELYTCGRAAAEALTRFIAGRTVFCTDLRADKQAARRVGQCFVDGVDLNHWLVEKGWALSFEPEAKGRFKTDEEEAKAGRFGLWNGCFVAPQNFRRWTRTAPLLGPGCLPSARDRLFPDEVAKPVGFAVKGHYALRAAPYDGIYHLPTCGSFQRTKAKRWFRTEEEAIAAGFRKSFTCGWW